jgi:SAM-dependent methyltransferase
VYELENAAIDPAGVLDSAPRQVAPWAGRDVLDLGCGSGFWLPYYARTARSVTGMEPDPSLLEQARARDARVRVEPGSALADGGCGSIPTDRAHLRLRTVLRHGVSLPEADAPMQAPELAAEWGQQVVMAVR